MTEPEISAQIKNVTSPWFRCFLTLNPQDYLSQVKCPLLAINGASISRCLPGKIFQAIEKAMIFGR